MRKQLSAALAVLSTLAPIAVVQGQGDTPRSVSLSLEANAIARVKGAYLAMDYVGGVEEGDQLLRRFPKSRELAAWRVANLARADRPRDAQAAAQALVTANAKDPWGWFAKTFVAEYAAESPNDADVLKASLEAYRRSATNPTIEWLRVFALANNGQSGHALALIDSVAARGSLTQEMRTQRATALFNAASSGTKTDQAKVDSAFASYAAVRASDSTDAAAYTFAASRMLNTGRNGEALELARRGARLSPSSLVAHETYWRAIDGMKERSQAQRDSEVLADLDPLLRSRGNQPTVLASAAWQYASRRRPEQSRQLEDRVVAEFPTSLSAEKVLVNRYRAMDKDRRDSTNTDSTLTTRYKRALWAFVNRPTHQQDRLLGDAYRSLFFVTDSTTNADTLLTIVRGMVKYEGINPHIVYADGAIRLAERGRDFSEAEKVARAGLKAGRQKIDAQRAIYETVGDYAHAVDWMSSFMYDALGVVSMRQRRLDDAEKLLEHAHDLDPNSTRALYHLGRLAEQRGQLDAAEQFYIKGSLLSSLGTNPNRAALRALYVARKGSVPGYDTYLGSLAEIDRANRRAAIAKSRAAAPKAISPFRLRDLNGAIVSADSLRGKTTVINSWGMWCGPCVAEMPELQKLAAQYAGDSTVRVLTIDNDPNTDELRSWLQKKGYTFTTLIDDGYLGRVNLHTFPTTWFLDSKGRVVFTKVGWSENLAEEFGWRIEMIRNPGPTP